MKEWEGLIILEWNTKLISSVLCMKMPEGDRRGRIRFIALVWKLNALSNLIQIKLDVTIPN